MIDLFLTISWYIDQYLFPVTFGIILLISVIALIDGIIYDIKNYFKGDRPE